VTVHGWRNLDTKCVSIRANKKTSLP
jgi:hypothetical protein